MLKQSEDPIDVKMHEFGQLLNDVEDLAYACQLEADRDIYQSRTRDKYQEARQRLLGAIRAAVEIVISQNATNASKVGWMGDVGGNPYGPFDR